MFYREIVFETTPFFPSCSEVHQECSSVASRAFWKSHMGDRRHMNIINPPHHTTTQNNEAACKTNTRLGKINKYEKKEPVSWIRTNGNIKLLYETGIWYEEASTLTVPLDTSHISCHMEKNHHFDDRILSHFIASPLSSGQRLGT